MCNLVYEATLNLLIGIVGGIFSSIIVSYIFLIDSDYKNQIGQAKRVFDSIYGILALGMTYDQAMLTSGKKNASEITCIDDSGQASGTIKTIDVMNNYWNKITDFYTNYEPWNYKFALGDILNEVSDIISDGKYTLRRTPEDFSEIRAKFRECVKKFENCQRNYKKGVAEQILSSKLIRLFEIILVSIIIVFIAAA